ncbi:hypothetical protein [Moheibacter sp.]|uniref:hypothetical protein n=1 Tax=Moheibacter sp. TaxID=1965316 RepID=UPI003C75D936
MNLIVRRQFYYNPHSYELWSAGTAISCLAYIIGVSYFELSFTNFYLLSFLIIVQLYFWICNQYEVFEFDQNSFKYRFLFFKWKMRLSSYQVVGICYDKDPTSRFPEKENSECLFLQNEKVRFKILKSNWELEKYEKIKTYLETNFPENNSIKKPFILFKFTSDLTLLFVLFFFFTSILTLGVYLENPKNTKIENFVYIESTLSSDSKYITPKGSNYIRIKLVKYPGYKFMLFENGIKELRKNGYATKFYKFDTIGFLIDKNDYEKSLHSYSDYPYFTSHVKNKKEISIKGIYYKDKYILDQYDYAKGNSRNEKLWFLLPCLFAVIWVISIFSNKIKYTNTKNLTSSKSE